MATGKDGKALVSILLLSDGASTQGISTDDAIGLAKDAGIAVHTIALGTDAGTVAVPNELGEPQTVSVAPDRETLEQIAGPRPAARTSTHRPSRTSNSVYEAVGSQVAWDEEKQEVTVAFAGAGAVRFCSSPRACPRSGSAGFPDPTTREEVNHMERTTASRFDPRAALALLGLVFVVAAVWAATALASGGSSGTPEWASSSSGGAAVAVRAGLERGRSRSVAGRLSRPRRLRWRHGTVRRLRLVGQRPLTANRWLGGSAGPPQP